MEQQEVLFRGKRKDNGKWVEGNLVKVESGDTYIFNHYFIPTMSVPSSKFIEVIPETVGQYINKKDKNGVKLFGGDIINKHVNYKYKHNGLSIESTKIDIYREYSIEYCFDKMSFIYVSLTKEPSFLEFGTGEIEVTGTIHD